MRTKLNRRKALCRLGAPGVVQMAWLTGGAAAMAQSGAGTAPVPAASTGASADAATPQLGRTGTARMRSDLLAALPELQRAGQATGASDAQRLALARAHFELGQWDPAMAQAQALAASAPGLVDAVELAARLEAMTGQLEAASARWQALIARPDLPPARRVRAQVALLLLNYRRDDFRAMVALPLPPHVVLPLLDQVRAFDSPPYQANWATAPAERLARLPFAAIDPLPLLPIRVMGQDILVLLDTGADQLVLDSELADRLGLERLGAARGQFAGGRTAPVGFGRIDELQLGPLRLQSVPVHILPTRHFTQDPGLPVQGVLGTALLRQCLATVDYKRRLMVLRERGAPARLGLDRERAHAAVLPFALDATHLLFVRGSLDDSPPLTFFLDTGLAAEQAVVAPEQTLHLLGKAVPALPGQGSTAAGAGIGVGGGGAVSFAPFELRRITLGPLEQTGLGGLYGPLPASSYWTRGFIQDALLSHQFLRRYCGWTLDFDRHELLIHR
jgi:hypothetical protein